MDDYIRMILMRQKLPWPGELSAEELKALTAAISENEEQGLTEAAARSRSAGEADGQTRTAGVLWSPWADGTGTAGEPALDGYRYAYAVSTAAAREEGGGDSAAQSGKTRTGMTPEALSLFFQRDARRFL